MNFVNGYSENRVHSRHGKRLPCNVGIMMLSWRSVHELIETIKYSLYCTLFFSSSLTFLYTIYRNIRLFKFLWTTYFRNTDTIGQHNIGKLNWKAIQYRTSTRSTETSRPFISYKSSMEEPRIEPAISSLEGNDVTTEPSGWTLHIIPRYFFNVLIWYFVSL